MHGLSPAVLGEGWSVQCNVTHTRGMLCVHPHMRISPARIHPHGLVNLPGQVPPEDQSWYASAAKSLFNAVVPETRFKW